MTMKEYKQITKEISRLRSKLVRLESEAVKITPTMSEAPASSGISDKVGNNASEILDNRAEIDRLEAEKSSALNSLSREDFVENCLYMRLHSNFSWIKIAMKFDGKHTWDSIRKKCERHNW